MPESPPVYTLTNQPAQLDALPIPAVNLARRARLAQQQARQQARQQKRGGSDDPIVRVKLEIIFLADGSWLLTVDDSRQVEHLGKE